ncbi:MAG: ABC transporter ATP-binding protein/permease [Clostridiales Family XIII bacterium]|nr:ABC transporter ATP-binding protein/permease [Clostridiales Family XIII bacterium]
MTKRGVAGIVAIVLLLFVQAYCELELPNYTQDIVDVGIMQYGIENAAPTEVRASTLDGLKAFMLPDEKAMVEEAYSPSDDDPGVMRLKDEYLKKKTPLERLLSFETFVGKKGEEKIAELSKAFELPILILSAGQGGSSDEAKAMIPAITGIPDEEAVKAVREEVEKRLERIGLGSSMMQTAAIAFVKAEYDAIGVDVQGLESSYMKNTGITMILFTLVSIAAAILVGLIASVVSAENSMILRRRSFDRILSYSNREMDEFSSASLITRSTNDIQQVQIASVMGLRMVLYSPAMAAGGIFMITKTDTNLGWIVIAAVLTLAALIGILLGLTMPKFLKMQILIDRLNLVTREILTGLPVIRAFTREGAERGRFKKANVDLLANQLFTNRVMSSFFPLIMLIMNATAIVIIWFGGKGVDEGVMQVGGLLAFISYSIFIIMSFMMLSMATIILPRASVAARRVLEVNEKETSVKDAPAETLKDGRPFTGKIEFDKVSFRYPNAEEDALTDVSFIAEPSKTTAIIGSTGSGKSTIVGLMPRLFDVTGGCVKIDGVDIRELSLNKLRSMIGVVPQKAVLFSGTIDSNIRFGGGAISEEEMKNAAAIAQADDFIEEKELGYEEEIARGGSNVSGGQRQRLAMARAIAKDPLVFVFDDSFSALDYRTDANLRRALSEKLGDRTVVIVAQRISTIMGADNILVLEEGKIVGQGTHTELLRTCEVYREIAESQLSEEELGA